MERNNPDVLLQTKGDRAHEERQEALDRARDSILVLFVTYSPPFPQKGVIDAVAFEQGCSQDTTQGFVDALSSIHPRSPFIAHEVKRKAHISPKDSQLLTEDADRLPIPKKCRTGQRKGGGNA